MLAVNGESLAGLSHAEAIAVFRNIRAGKVVLHVVRRSAGSPQFSAATPPPDASEAANTGEIIYAAKSLACV